MRVSLLLKEVDMVHRGNSFFAFKTTLFGTAFIITGRPTTRVTGAAIDIIVFLTGARILFLGGCLAGLDSQVDEDRVLHLRIDVRNESFDGGF